MSKWRQSRLRGMSDKQSERAAKLGAIKIRLLAERGTRCERCQAEQTWLDLHHLLSRARGGQDVPENLALLCRPCHQAITALAVEDWPRWVLSSKGGAPGRS